MSYDRILAVTGAASSLKLTTVSAATDAIGSTPTTPAVSTVIDRSSAAIASYCNRVFAKQTYSETFRRRWRDGYRFGHPVEHLRLSSPPVPSIASVVEDGTTLDPTADYEWDIGAGLLYRLLGGIRSPWFAQTIAIVYNGGFVLPGNSVTAPDIALPADVEDACVKTVVAYYEGLNTNSFVRSETEQGVGSTTYIARAADGGIIPPDACGSLASWIIWDI